jgi:adenosylcobinamide-phosphate synthase
MTIAAWFTAWLLDLWLGDPPHWPHPVRWIGNAINYLQRQVRRYCHSQRALRIGGAIMWLLVVGGSGLLCWALLRLAYLIYPALGWLIEVWIIYTVLATRCLADAAREVERPLRVGDIAQSREKLGWIVGRDTSQLEPEQITRAVVETVAENSVDGVIAPLFFLLIGGAPLAIAYKAVNTLDSMVGYKNAKYRAIGMVSARLDDVANYLPARLSWLLLTMASLLAGRNYRAAFRIGWRDRRAHSSPNCAWSEATVAGALGIRLGGPNNYFGERVEKPWLGDNTRAVEVDDISRTIQLMMIACWLALGLFTLLRLWLVGWE